LFNKKKKKKKKKKTYKISKLLILNKLFGILPVNPVWDNELNAIKININFHKYIY